MFFLNNGSLKWLVGAFFHVPCQARACVVVGTQAVRTNEMVEDHSTVFVLLAGNLEHISHPLIECHLLLVFPLMTSLTDHGDFLLTCWAGPQRLGRKKRK